MQLVYIHVDYYIWLTELFFCYDWEEANGLSFEKSWPHFQLTRSVNWKCGHDFPKDNPLTSSQPNQKWFKTYPMLPQ